MMISLKMWCLLPLTVLLVSITHTVTEVVQLMSQCKGFFLQKPPQVPNIFENGQIKGKSRYKIICQTYSDTRRFVTLYDTENKIPVLSAYKFRGEKLSEEKEGRPQIPWKIEPQLENPKSNKNMEDCDDRITYTKQASDNDYKNNKGYSRGHLFPSSYGFDESDKISTFTLTNIVPQAESFNNGSWEEMETCVKCILKNYCKNKEGYVVTGAKPGTKKLNNRINIPSMLWSAFCCNDGGKTWLASAFWRLNVPDKSNSYVLMRTLTDLYDKLSTSTKSFNAFPEQNNIRCSLTETAHKRYPEIKDKCGCPKPRAYEAG